MGVKRFLESNCRKTGCLCLARRLYPGEVTISVTSIDVTFSGSIVVKEPGSDTKPVEAVKIEPLTLFTHQSRLKPREPSPWFRGFVKKNKNNKKLQELLSNV